MKRNGCLEKKSSSSRISPSRTDLHEYSGANNNGKRDTWEGAVEVQLENCSRKLIARDNWVSVPSTLSEPVFTTRMSGAIPIPS